MSAIQTKVLNDLTQVIEQFGFEALELNVYSNLGRLSIQVPEQVGELARVNFDFQSDQMTFMLLVGETPVPSQPGRSDYFNFLIKYTDIDKYRQFRSSLEQVLKQLQSSAAEDIASQAHNQSYRALTVARIAADSAVYVPFNCEGVRITSCDSVDSALEEGAGFVGTGEETGNQYRIEYAEVDLEEDMFYRLAAVDVSQY